MAGVHLDIVPDHGQVQESLVPRLLLSPLYIDEVQNILLGYILLATLNGGGGHLKSGTVREYLLSIDIVYI